MSIRDKIFLIRCIYYLVNFIIIFIYSYLVIFRSKFSILELMLLPTITIILLILNKIISISYEEKLIDNNRIRNRLLDLEYKSFYESESNNTKNNNFNTEEKIKDNSISSSVNYNQGKIIEIYDTKTNNLVYSSQNTRDANEFNFKFGIYRLIEKDIDNK